MKPFRQMNKTLQFFLIFLVLAVCTAVSFFALDYNKLTAKGFFKDFDMDDFSIEFYGDGRLFGIGKYGAILNSFGFSSFSPFQAHDFRYDLDEIRHLTFRAGTVEMTVVRSDTNRIHITSDTREIREERKDGTLTLDAGKKHSISCRVECTNPAELDLVVKGGAIEFENDAELKSVDLSAAAVEFQSKTEHSYPVKIEGVSVEGKIAVRENHYKVNLRGTAVEWNGTDVTDHGETAFTKTFGTGRDALEISGVAIELSLDD